jgi:hypothetical protein
MINQGYSKFISSVAWIEAMSLSIRCFSFLVNCMTLKLTGFCNRGTSPVSHLKVSLHAHMSTFHVSQILGLAC